MNRELMGTGNGHMHGVAPPDFDSSHPGVNIGTPPVSAPVPVDDADDADDADDVITEPEAPVMQTPQVKDLAENSLLESLVDSLSILNIGISAAVPRGKAIMLPSKIVLVSPADFQDQINKLNSVLKGMVKKKDAILGKKDLSNDFWYLSMQNTYNMVVDGLDKE